MNNFISQNKSAFKKRRKRWKPKGRQINTFFYDEIQNLFQGKLLVKNELIEYLHVLQDKYGCLYDQHLTIFAELINIPLAEIYEVATFYAHFNIVKNQNKPEKIKFVRVCESLTCELFGSQKILEELNKNQFKNVKIVSGPCMGRCNLAPTVCVGKNYIDKTDSIEVTKAIKANDFEVKIPQYINFDEYISNDGYLISNKVKNNQISNQDIINLLNTSGLKGKGGAGFPTGKKWEIVSQYEGIKYLAINGDEGEPGTFKDRHYLESDPHRFLEGVVIASHFINAHKVYIYIRDEYPAAIEILKNEIIKLEENNLIKKDFFIIRRGAGAYICGEESAMLESIEGKRGLPRHKPPYAAEVGLFGKPTLINNVETIYWIRDIIEKGPEWFASQGKKGMKGFHSFSVSGRVRNPGVKIAPAGITVKELINEYCDGILDGHSFKGYLPGGASGGILPSSLDNIPLDYNVKELDDMGCFLGSAAIVILSDKDNIMDVGLNLLKFFEDESCGQCTPCRVGTEKTVKLMQKNKWNKKQLEDLSLVMGDASICGLGQAATNPLKSIIKFFSDEIKYE